MASTIQDAFIKGNARAMDGRGYGAEEMPVDAVQSGSLRACNARTLESLDALNGNTMALLEIIDQLGDSSGPSISSGSLGRASDKEPPEPSAPIFQARRIEQRLDQQIGMQRELIGKLRSLIG